MKPKMKRQYNAPPRGGLRWVIIGAVLGIVGAGIVLITSSTVHVGDIVLSSTCGLADAITAANRDEAAGGCRAGRGADEIVLTADIVLEVGLPKITSDITITITGGGYTISGDNRHRIFYNDGGALTIRDLTMIDGQAMAMDDSSRRGVMIGGLNTTANHIGGAIVNWRGAVTISDSAFRGNSAGQHGGAIYNEDELSIVNSTFSGNSAYWGGAIYNFRGAVTIGGSEFHENSASYGGAIYNREGGQLSVDDSSVFSDNRQYRQDAICDEASGEVCRPSG